MLHPVTRVLNTAALCPRLPSVLLLMKFLNKCMKQAVHCCLLGEAGMCHHSAGHSSVHGIIRLKQPGRQKCGGGGGSVLGPLLTKTLGFTLCTNSNETGWAGGGRNRTDLLR